MELGFGEDDVRRLGGEAVLAWADLLQRGGHVLGPTASARPTRGVPVGAAVLSADVRGVWRRVDRANAIVNGGRIVPTCGCGAPQLCRHVAALLHWLRAPGSFADAPSAPPGPARASEANPPAAAPADDLAGLLERETMTRLRALARERGVAVRAANKTDLIEQLALALADPAGVDAALACLGVEEGRMLDAVHLLAAYSTPTEEAVTATYAALGGAGRPPVDRPLALGLLLRQPLHGYGPPCYLLPRSVASRSTTSSIGSSGAGRARRRPRLGRPGAVPPRRAAGRAAGDGAALGEGLGPGGAGRGGAAPGGELRGPGRLARRPGAPAAGPSAAGRDAIALVRPDAVERLRGALAERGMSLGDQLLR